MTIHRGVARGEGRSGGGKSHWYWCARVHRASILLPLLNSRIGIEGKEQIRNIGRPPHCRGFGIKDHSGPGHRAGVRKGVDVIPPPPNRERKGVGVVIPGLTAPLHSDISVLTERIDMGILDHPDAKAFILHWGEMGTYWGVNRSVAQVHALLYLSDRPLDAETIVETLGLARSNVSTGLKELQSYAIVRRVHVEGDRRDHFVAETDLWEMLMRISAERKRREIDPTIELLAELTERLKADPTAPAQLRERVTRMHEFIATLANWYEQVRTLPKPTLVTLMKLGSRVARFIPGGKKQA